MSGKKTILAVDDNSINLVMLKAILSRDFVVITLEDGNLTVDEVISKKPDLVLLDVMLPGKNGFDICKSLKAEEKTSDIPVVFVTGCNDPQSIVKGFLSGCADYICKPFSSEEFLMRVKTQLERFVKQNDIKNLSEKISQENKELRKQVEVLNLMKDNMPDAQVICTLDGKIVSWSKSCKDVFLCQESLKDVCFWDIADLEKDKDVMKNYFLSLNSQHGGVLKYIIHREEKDKILVLESLGKVVDLSNGSFVVVNTKNITGQANTRADERKQLEFQKRLRLVIQNANSLHSFTASCVYLTQELSRLTNAGEIVLLLGRKDNQTEFFYHNNTFEECKRGKLQPSDRNYEKFVEFLKKQTSSVVCNIQEDNIPDIFSSRNRRYVLFPIVLDNVLVGLFYLGKNSQEGITPENIYAVATIATLVKNNISKKNYEKTIFRQEKEILNFFKYSANGMITVSSSGNLLRYNRRFLELFNIQTNSDLTGKPLNKVLKGNVLKQVLSLIDKVGKPPLFETISIVSSKGNGVKTYIEATASKISFAKDLSCSIIFTDVTGLKNMDSAVLTATTAAEEKERIRLARELHDGLGAQLSSVNIYINLILSGGVETSEVFRTLKLAKDILSQAIDSVKEIADNLHPVILTRFGLVATINNIIEGLENSRLIKFGFTHSQFTELEDKNLELSIFRIINELINNTMKHSKAKNIAISLISGDDNLIVEYADDGIGFEKKRVNLESNGRGLQNIAARVKAVDGKCVFRTFPGKGFKVFIEIPII